MQPPRKELRPWHFAGLLTTWWCNARCAFCYVHASPEQGGTLAPEDAVACWARLDRLAARDGRHTRIHLTGGEPFGNWANLVAILRAAKDAGLPPPQKVETNAFWAVDDALTRERLQTLHEIGVPRLDVSTDVFHQEYVDIDRVRRCIRIGREVFGPEGVRARWDDYVSGNDPIILAGRPADQREPAYVGSFRRHPERLTGRAAFTLAHLLEQRSIEDLAGENCLAELLKSKHIHVGPEGSVFPGVCSGILLGNALAEPLDEMWDRLASHWRDEPILAPLIEEGPIALYRLACEHGYRPLEGGYAGKCHLCTHVRHYLFDLGLFPAHLGPGPLYGHQGAG
jgi:hypothetical protein